MIDCVLSLLSLIVLPSLSLPMGGGSFMIRRCSSLCANPVCYLGHHRCCSYQPCDLVFPTPLFGLRSIILLSASEQKRIATEGVALALSRQLTFDEDKVLRLITPYIAASMNLPGGAEVVTQDVARTKIVAGEDGWKGSANIVENAEPRNPGIHFWTRHA